MKSLNPTTESCTRNGVIGLGLIPGHGPVTINIMVSHGISRYEVVVPLNSNFGYLKSVICHNIGLNPETYKLFFGGIEKEDNENLQTAGVMNNSELLLIEITQCEQTIHEDVQETCVISKGEDAVAEVRREVDKLVQQVSALQAVVESGNKVDGKEIIYLTELLMRQLLKLDGIEAEGEGKVQRKMEVRRVQSIVETLDALKSRNSNSFSNTRRNLSPDTQSRVIDSGCQTVNDSSPIPPPTPPQMPPSSPSHMPPSSPSHMPPSTPSPMPPSSPYPVPQFMPSNDPSSTFPSVQYSFPNAPLPVPYYMHSAYTGVQYSAPNSPFPYFTPSTFPSMTPSPVPYFDPSQISYFAPSTPPFSTASPVPSYAPSHMPPPAPFSMPSSSKVTQNWEHFD